MFFKKPKKQRPAAKPGKLAVRLAAWYAKVKIFFAKAWEHPQVKALCGQSQELAQDINHFLERWPVYKKYRNKVVNLALWGRLKRISARTWTIGLILFVVLIVAGNIFQPWRKKAVDVQRRVRCDAFKVEVVDFTDELPAMGQVEGGQSADLAFQAGGTVAKINLRDGQTVKAGDTIAELDPTDAQLKLQYQDAKVRAAQEKLFANRELYELKSLTHSRLAEIQAEYDSQEKERDFAGQELKKTKLVSPVSGVLGPMLVEPGENVTPQTKITSVFNLEEVFIELGVIEKDIRKVRVGQEVAASVDAYAGLIKNGTVATVSPSIESKSRDFRVRARIANIDPATQFMSGMFARAKIAVYRAPGALVVPLTALDKDNKVYCVNNGAVQARPVQIAYTSYDWVHVSSGLKAGEMVVAEVEAELADGTQVEILNRRTYSGKSEPAEVRAAPVVPGAGLWTKITTMAKEWLGKFKR